MTDKAKLGGFKPPRDCHYIICKPIQNMSIYITLYICESVLCTYMIYICMIYKHKQIYLYLFLNVNGCKDDQSIKYTAVY